MPPPEILIVEDDAAIREGVADVLAMSGFRPLEARNGQEALQLLREAGQAPRAILLDMLMPHMNGWQFRAELLADPRLCDIPVVIMSVLKEADSVPGHAHIPKPFGYEQLLHTLARVTQLDLT
jgi:CheY-like chemotaxis protein